MRSPIPKSIGRKKDEKAGILKMMNIEKDQKDKKNLENSNQWALSTKK